jgi:hypothetical protein
MRCPKPIIAVLLLLVSLNLYSEDAIVVEARGLVETRKSGAESWLAVIPGAKLSAGDEIRTGENGSALLLFSDSSRYDMFSNSRLTVTAAEIKKRAPFLSRLWAAVTGKYDDTAYTSASAGGVGVLRGDGLDNEFLQDFELGEEEQTALAELLEVFDGFASEDSGSMLLSAIILESFEQYARAEQLYIQYLESRPEDSFGYDILVELYMENDLYSHAQQTLVLKAEYAAP